MRGELSRGGVRAAVAAASLGPKLAAKDDESPSYESSNDRVRAKEQQQADSLFYPELFGQPIEYYFYPNSSVPVFCPTSKQFGDFEALVTAIEPLSLRAGVCKIVPPKKWRQELETSSGTMGEPRVFADERFPILKPIVQHFNGSSGIFHQYNVEFHRKVRLAQFFQTSQDASHRVPEGKSAQTDSDDVADDVYRSDTMGIAVDYASGRVRLTSSAADALKQALRTDSARERFRPAAAEYRPQPDTRDEPAAEHNGVQPQRRFTADDGRALFVSAQEYLVNEELERMYWKNLLFQPPMYGADVLGTLYPEPEKFPTWNIRRLPGLLQKVKRSMPGVNDPYLYLGMWKATFAWHVEDMDLYSINYIHFGAPKAWYSIPVEARGRFEMSMQNVFANDYKTCSQFLRHKAFLMSPRFLASQGIPFNRVVQRAGEIMLTFPLGYHAGFNHGFNCAESVNFALDRWLDIASESKHCECVKDSVTIDLMEWFGGMQKDMKMVVDGDSTAPVAAAVASARRASPRRHAAAAAAIARNNSVDKPPSEEAAPAPVKRLPGRPRKTDAVAATRAAARKRKAADICEDGRASKAKRVASTASTTSATFSQQQQQQQQGQNLASGGGQIDNSELLHSSRQRFASLHTPVGTCGACLLRMDLEEPDDKSNQDNDDGESSAFVECRQCGLTVHPQCSALSFDDGNYKCANCVMDTDQLSCALCAFQNGLLLPAAAVAKPQTEDTGEATEPPVFVHFLCAHFIDELYFDLPHGHHHRLSHQQQQQQQQQQKKNNHQPDKIMTRSRSSRNTPTSFMDNNGGLAVGNSARVCGLEKVSKTRYAAKCIFCHGHCVGAAVQCAQPRCFRTFHPMCAATKNPQLLDWSLAKIYCPSHHATSTVAGLKNI